MAVALRTRPLMTRPTSLRLARSKTRIQVRMSWTRALISEEQISRPASALGARRGALRDRTAAGAAGTVDAGWKMVFLDPSGYAVELKCYTDPGRMLHADKA